MGRVLLLDLVLPKRSDIRGYEGTGNTPVLTCAPVELTFDTSLLHRNVFRFSINNIIP